MAVKRPAPTEGQLYKHFKGSIYQVVTIAVHTETSDKLVVYRSIERPERVFARPLEMFMSEVDHLRYPLVRAKYRFTLMAEVVEEYDDDEVEEKCEDVEVADAAPVDEETVAQVPVTEDVQTETENEDECKSDVADTTEIEETPEDTCEELTEDDTAKYKADGELVLDPYVEAVLDEKQFTKKIENFEFLRGKCTDDMLTMIAISLDIQLMGDTVEEKYAEILKTLRMHEKYESARLRS